MIDTTPDGRPGRGTRRLLVADRLVDGTGTDPIVGGAVLIEGERIVAVGPAERLRHEGAVEQRYPGRTILPGLVDSHLHLELSAGPDHAITLATFEADRDAGRLEERAMENARSALAAGITTVGDCGSTLDVLAVRDAVAAGAIRPRILAAGPPVTTTAGHCYWWGGCADSIEEIRAGIRHRIEAGVDRLKIMATGGIMTPASNPHRPQYDAEVLRAAVAEAHRLGLRVVAHALATAGIADAFAADVDSIDHAGWAGPDGRPAPDPDLVARIGRAGRAIGLTTSGIVRIELDRGEEGVAALRARMRDKVELAAAGARIHIHSDAGVRFTPFDRPDLNLQAAVAGTGMSTHAAIAAMTGVAADVLDLGDEVGTLRPGLRADLLVVDGDPTVDLAMIRNVHEVWRDGLRVVVRGRIEEHQGVAGGAPALPEADR